MRTTILLAAIIGLLAIVIVKKPDDEPTKPSLKTESKDYPGGTMKYRYTNEDGTVRCTLVPPGKKAVRIDCADFDK